MRFRLSLCLFAAAYAVAGCECPGGVRAVIVDADGAPRLEVCAGLAETAEERMLGLMGMTLDAEEGLLLRFPVEGEICITNSGVMLDLDLVWVDASGAVTAVERDVPAEDATLRCHLPAQDVLEVRAGIAASVMPGQLLQLD